MAEKKSNLLTIGQLADRLGISVSAIRYYEAQGLVAPHRNEGRQRRFLWSDLRKLSFVLIAQQFGFTLVEIKEQLDALPNGRAPTKEDWTRMSRALGDTIDEKIAQMTRLRNRLDGCIGCGCLSLRSCKLYNPEDGAARYGTGPRFVLTGESVSR